MSIRKFSRAMVSVVSGLLCTMGLFLAGGCDQSEKGPSGGEVAKASRQEVAELQSALDDDARKDAETARATGGSTASETVQKSTGARRDEVIEKPAPAVTGFSPSRQGFELQFNEVPDLTVLKDFIKVTPNPGGLSQDW